MIKRFSQRMALKYNNGVTLIELLIVLSVIAILSSISYPIYTSFLLKEHRIKAIEALIKLQLHIETSYISAGNGTPLDKYKKLLSTSISKSNGGCNLAHICQLNTDRYRLSYKIGESGTSRYTLLAVPQKKSNQTSDKCGTLRLHSTGNTQANIEGCW